MNLRKPPPPVRPVPSATKPLRCPGDGAILAVLNPDGTLTLRCPGCKTDHKLAIVSEFGFIDGRLG